MTRALAAIVTRSSESRQRLAPETRGGGELRERHVRSDRDLSFLSPPLRVAARRLEGKGPEHAADSRADSRGRPSAGHDGGKQRIPALNASTLAAPVHVARPTARDSVTSEE
jgi:hypothetical protein